MSIEMSTSSRSRSSRGDLAPRHPLVDDPLHQRRPAARGPRRGCGTTRCRRTGRRTRSRRCRARARGSAGRTTRRAPRGTACRSGSCSSCRWSARRTSRAGRSPPRPPTGATIRLISASMVCAWPRIMSPRSAWFFSICWRSSGTGVEDHALAEDRRHERVRRRLVERGVRRPEELLVGLGAAAPARRRGRRAGTGRCRRTPRGPGGTGRSGRPASRPGVRSRRPGRRRRPL